MIRAKWYSKPWFLGIVSFMFQISLLLFGPLSYYVTETDILEATLLAPMDPGFLAVKYLVLVLCILTQDDVLSAVHNIITSTAFHDANLAKLINEDVEQIFLKRGYLGTSRVLFPNMLKMIQGVLVLVVTFYVLLGSENPVDLLKVYTALLVLSQIDNVMFYIVEYGYFGSNLAKAADEVKSFHIEQERLTTRCELIVKMIVMVSLLCALFVPFGFIVERQQTGRFFNATYPYCAIGVENIPNIGDGICQGGIYNTIGCAFDGGDCTQFNFQYPNCRNAPEPFRVGDGICNEIYNNVECGFDGNDCCPFDKANFTHPRFGDGMCDGGYFFADMCTLDGSDCLDYVRRAPKCDYDELASLVPSGQEPKLGDGVCESTVYNTPECLFENGDCDVCNSKVFEYSLTGDGTCHGGPHNTATCNFDGGDCKSFNEKWPKCIEKTKGMYSDNMELIPIIGNGICDSGLYMIEECGFEDGECYACDELIDDVTKIGNGFCDGQAYMSEACGFDGGDCVECNAPLTEIGNGQCALGYNTTKCGYDGGDCLPSAMPSSIPSSSPTLSPSFTPTLSSKPSSSPTSSPSVLPSTRPSTTPSSSPTSSPSRSMFPTISFVPTSSTVPSMSPITSSMPSQCAIQKVVQVGDSVEAKAAGDDFGSSVSISSNGKTLTLAIGGRYNDGNSGGNRNGDGGGGSHGHGNGNGNCNGDGHVGRSNHGSRNGNGFGGYTSSRIGTTSSRGRNNKKIIVIVIARGQSIQEEKETY